MERQRAAFRDRAVLGINRLRDLGQWITRASFPRALVVRVLRAIARARTPRRLVSPARPLYLWVALYRRERGPFANREERSTLGFPCAITSGCEVVESDRVDCI